MGVQAAFPEAGLAPDCSKAPVLGRVWRPTVPRRLSSGRSGARLFQGSAPDSGRSSRLWDFPRSARVWRSSSPSPRADLETRPCFVPGQEPWESHARAQRQADTRRRVTHQQADRTPPAARSGTGSPHKQSRRSRHAQPGAGQAIPQSRHAPNQATEKIPISNTRRFKNTVFYGS